MDPILPVRRTSVCLLGLTALLTALFVSGQISGGGARERCTADVDVPIQVRVLAETTPHPGAAVRVRVLVDAQRPFSQASLRVQAPSDVAVTSGRTGELGALAVGRPAAHAFTIVVPPHGQRRTVDVIVRASEDDGLVIEKGATLNLSFQEEPSRVVTDASGAKVREVLARRIQ